MATNIEPARGSFQAFVAGDLDAYIGFFTEIAELEVYTSHEQTRRAAGLN